MHSSEYYITSLGLACTVIYIYFLDTFMGWAMGGQPCFYLAGNVRETRRDNPGIDNPDTQATSVTRHKTHKTQN
jgi:hypothetical protein